MYKFCFALRGFLQTPDFLTPGLCPPERGSLSLLLADGKGLTVGRERALRFRGDAVERTCKDGNILPRYTPPQALATVDAMRTYTDTATNEIFSRMGQAGPSPTDLRARREHARVQARSLSVDGCR